MIKKLLGIIFILSLIAFYLFLLRGNVSQDYTLKIASPKNFEEVKDSLKAHNVIANSYIFDIIQLVYKVNTVPAGCYKITTKMTSLDVMRKLKYGQQDPINFTLSTATFIEEVAKKAGDKFNFDSAQFMAALFNSQNMAQYNYNEQTVLCRFIPNTYELYWTNTPEQFLKKYFAESEKFWTNERKQKATQLHLTPDQIYTLASLVQKEYMRKDERSKIAAVLLNRLSANMPLQVDATCKYATRDFAAKRVLNYHTTYPSPYNTYLHLGLPPGPICIPETGTIDAVLNSENHDYIYYCADPSLNGYHIFSKTLTEHEAVAKQYHQTMNELKIGR